MTRQRLPLIDPDKKSAYAVVHKSLIDDYLVRQGMQAAANLGTATLEQLLADSEAGKTAKGSFVVLANTATLADVKQQMERCSKQSRVSCEDAFITSPGSDTVEGWITNDIINANALSLHVRQQNRLIGTPAVHAQKNLPVPSLPAASASQCRSAAAR